ncbi:ATP-binding protein [Amycolatopsis sp. NPDC058340]|uniref:ATP-binding protein n=1 Tax=Amycolatopsis sp. NPDC058340 TaxID=3346453 RepID=UPI003651EED8
MSTQQGISPRNEPKSGDVAYDLETTLNRDVRAGVRRLLGHYSGLTVDDAVLVTDELVSNANRHGEEPRTCRLGLRNGGRSLLIEVDDSSAHQPRIRPPHAGGGRGLVLVDRLATTWGVRNHAEHKTVWAELTLDRDGSSGHARHLRVAGAWATPESAP